MNPQPTRTPVDHRGVQPSHKLRISRATTVCPQHHSFLAVGLAEDFHGKANLK